MDRLLGIPAEKPRRRDGATTGSIAVSDSQVSSGLFSTQPAMPRQVSTHFEGPLSRPQAPSRTGHSHMATSGAVSIARQGIWDKQRSPFGCELYDRSVPKGQHDRLTDERMLIHSLSLTQGAPLESDQFLFLNCTPESLQGTHLDLLNASRVVLDIPLSTHADAPDIAAMAQRFVRLQERGFRLAFDQGALLPSYAPWRPFASFIKLDARKDDPRHWQAVLNTTRWQTRARLIATRVESELQYQRMDGLGISLFQGYWLDQPSLLPAQTAKPRRSNVMQLQDMCDRRAQLQEVEALMRSDLVLGYSFLKYVRSARLGEAVGLVSLAQALRMVTVHQLYQWAELILPNTSLNPKASVWDERANVCGRVMMRLLALSPINSVQRAQGAFLLGYLSALPGALSQDMALAIQPLGLDAEMQQALLDHTGPLGPLLALAMACEERDAQRISELCDATRLYESHVYKAYLAALAANS